MGDLGQLIVAEGFKKLPKVQKIGQYGHTDWKSKKEQKKITFTYTMKGKISNKHSYN